MSLRSTLCESHAVASLSDWMNEGGQSSTGQLLDFMIDTHPASKRLKELAKEKGTNHFSLLTEILQNMVQEKGVPFMSYLTKDIQLYPDLHGKLSHEACCALPLRS